MAKSSKEKQCLCNCYDNFHCLETNDNINWDKRIVMWVWWNNEKIIVCAFLWTLPFTILTIANLKLFFLHCTMKTSTCKRKCLSNLTLKNFSLETVLKCKEKKNYLVDNEWIGDIVLMCRKILRTTCNMEKYCSQ